MLKVDQALVIIIINVVKIRNQYRRPQRDSNPQKGQYCELNLTH